MALADELKQVKERAQISGWDAAEKRLFEELGLGLPSQPLPADIRAGLDAFNKWAAAKGVRSLPAKPWVVAGWCLDAHSMDVPWGKIAATLQNVTEAHDHHHLADPCSSSIVRKTTEQVAPQIEPPRSWNKEEKTAWRRLPPDIRQAITRRENDRDKEIRRLQNEAADQRHMNGAGKPVQPNKDIENDCTEKRV